MFIKRTTRTLISKTYTNHLLVESVATERGHVTGLSVRWAPLARLSGSSWLIIFSSPWGGQESFLEHSAERQAPVKKATLAAKGKKKRNAGHDIYIDLVLRRWKSKRPGKLE